MAYRRSINRILPTSSLRIRTLKSEEGRYKRFLSQEKEVYGRLFFRFFVYFEADSSFLVDFSDNTFFEALSVVNVPAREHPSTWKAAQAPRTLREQNSILAVLQDHAGRETEVPAVKRKLLGCSGLKTSAAAPIRVSEGYCVGGPTLLQGLPMQSIFFG